LFPGPPMPVLWHNASVVREKPKEVHMNELAAAYFSIRTSPLGVAITFGATPLDENVETDESLVVKLSYQDAKALAVMLRRQLKRYEREGKVTITVPAEVMDGFGITPEEW